MHYLRGSLCALAVIVGVVAIPPVEATKVGSDASQEELSWRGGHRGNYYHRGGGRHYSRYPGQRYYRHRPVIYRPYYNQRPLYYPAPYYYDPYYPQSGVYLYFRT